MMACAPESRHLEIHSGAHVGTTTVGVILFCSPACQLFYEQLRAFMG